MNFIPLFYDAAAIIIAVTCIIKGAKDGFAKTAIQAVGYIFAIFAALAVSRICTSLIYTTAIQPVVIEKIEVSIANAVDTETVINGITSAIEGLPAISHLIFDFSGTVESLVNSIGLNFAEIALQVEESVVRPVAEALLETVIFAISLIILAGVVSLVAKGSKFINKVPVIGRVNSFFGGVFGIFNGVLELFIASFILDFVISAGLFPEYFSEKIISETYLFKWIYFAVCGNNALI